MEKDISKLQDHYILCGLNTYTGKIVEELSQTHRDHVIIEQESESIEDMKNNFKGESYIEGDPTEDEILKKAGIDRAKGVFAATNDDNINLVISLSAKRLNPKLRVIAFSFKQKNMEKMILAGADKVVSPTTIGGMRMASEMIRPTVTNFLDYMLRDSGKSFRIEEVIITDDYHGKKLVDVDINDLKSTVLMAIRTGEDWRFKPDEDSIINKGDILIVMTTPEERIKLEKMFD